jgi:hypothetical protein
MAWNDGDKWKVGKKLRKAMLGFFATLYTATSLEI